MKLLGITNVNLNVIDQLLSRFLYLSDSGEKTGVEGYNASAIYRFQESLWFR
jgi:hypothetical protein